MTMLLHNINPFISLSAVLMLSQILYFLSKQALDILRGVIIFYSTVVPFSELDYMRESNKSSYSALRIMGFGKLNPLQNRCHVLGFMCVHEIMPSLFSRNAFVMH